MLGDNPRRFSFALRFCIGTLEPISGLVQLERLDLYNCRNLTGTICCSGTTITKHHFCCPWASNPQPSSCPFCCWPWTPGLTACFLVLCSRSVLVVTFGCVSCRHRGLQKSQARLQGLRFSSKKPLAKGDWFANSGNQGRRREAPACNKISFFVSKHKHQRLSVANSPGSSFLRHISTSLGPSLGHFCFYLSRAN